MAKDRYIPVDLLFDRNSKTVHLKLLLNDPQAECFPQRLWRWCATEFPKGKPDPKLIEAALDWRGKPGALLEALWESGFIHRKSGMIANWRKRNPFFSCNQDGNHTSNHDVTADGNQRVIKIRDAVRRHRERKKAASNAVPSGTTVDVIGFKPPADVITDSADVITGDAAVKSPVLPPAHAWVNPKPEPEDLKELQLASAASGQLFADAAVAAKPQRKARTRKAQHPEEYTLEDHAFVRSFREDWEDTLNKPGRMRHRPLPASELAAAKRFRLEGWTDPQLDIQKGFFLNDKPREPARPGARAWPGWGKVVLSVASWWRHREEIQRQIDERAIRREDD